MNILLINPVHPGAGHISALRAWRFANELSALGHKVILLAANGPAGLEADAVLEAHDWAEPLVLAPAASDPSRGPTSRVGALRKLETAARVLIHGGYQSAWLSAAVTTAIDLAPAFRPDVVWATFGKLESLIAARRIARRLRLPWVMDLKDNWELFVPAGLRWLMTRRLRGWSAITSNAQFTRSQARQWHRADADLIYSGVDEQFIADGADPAPPLFRITLVGSVYFADRLQGLLEGVRLWASGLADDERRLVELRYLGGDTALVDQAVAGSGLDIGYVAEGYQPGARLAAVCRASAVNTYVAHCGSFHHKLLELLACQRPVLAYPRESEESRSIARAMGARLIEAGSAEAAASALSEIHRDWQRGARADRAGRCDQYSWRAQALLLQETLHRVGRTS